MATLGRLGMRVKGGQCQRLMVDREEKVKLLSSNGYLILAIDQNGLTKGFIMPAIHIHTGLPKAIHLPAVWTGVINPQVFPGDGLICPDAKINFSNTLADVCGTVGRVALRSPTKHNGHLLDVVGPVLALQLGKCPDFSLFRNYRSIIALLNTAHFKGPWTGTPRPSIFMGE